MRLNTYVIIFLCSLNYAIKLLSVRWPVLSLLLLKCDRTAFTTTRGRLLYVYSQESDSSSKSIASRRHLVTARAFPMFRSGVAVPCLSMNSLPSCDVTAGGSSGADRRPLTNLTQQSAAKPDSAGHCVALIGRDVTFVANLPVSVRGGLRRRRRRRLPPQGVTVESTPARSWTAPPCDSPSVKDTPSTTSPQSPELLETSPGFDYHA